MLKPEHIESLGADFEKSAKGFIDFLLLGNDGKPLIVLQAKSQDEDPRIGKEQARKYARSQNARFVILSNGNIHYRWDLGQGNPAVIIAFPGPDEIKNHYAFKPNVERLFTEKVERDFFVLTQIPG